MTKYNMRPKHNLLMIFAKNPEKGKVKTRLAKTIGAQKALEVYQELLVVTKSVTDPLPVDKQIWYSRYISDSDLWSSPGEGNQGVSAVYKKRLQHGKTLGHRMKNAFKDAFARDYQKVIIIGSDCCSLTSEHLKRAYRLLDGHRVVIGPARDGGYYLLGMSQFFPEVFEGKQWSTPSVCRDTIQQLEQWNVSYQLLPVLNDIDTEADLKDSNLAQIL